MGSSLGGGKGGGGGNKKSKAEKLQMQYANELFQDTDPIRQSLFSRSEDFLGGGMDVRETPAYEALKYSADSGFNQAKDNTISRFAPGGGLVDAMTNLEGQRAGTMTQGAGQIYDAELNRALQLGTGMTNTSMQSLGQAGSIQAQLAAANASESAAGKGAMGQAAGMAAGAYLGNK